VIAEEIVCRDADDAPTCGFEQVVPLDVEEPLSAIHPMAVALVLERDALCSQREVGVEDLASVHYYRHIHREVPDSDTFE